ncbi:MAG: hypothetical protein WCI71_08435 [Bacteroidota bacterium]
MQTKNAIRNALFGIGFFSIGTQVYLMREFMTVFYGNELILAMLLALWMLFSGAGAWFAGIFMRREICKGTVLLLLMLLSVLPAFMISGLDLLKAAIVPYGSMASLWNVIYIGGFIQLPFCLISGFLFSVLSLQLSRTVSVGYKVSESPVHIRDPFSMAYSFESLGSLMAGVVVNFIFLWIFNRYQGLVLITAGFQGMILLYACRVTGRLQLWLVVLFSTLFICFLLLFDFQDLAERIRYPGQRILTNRETPYGQVVVTGNDKQLNIYENGVLLCSSGNEMNNEEKVHFAMVQRPDPLHVLMISGGFTGTITEVLKYKPDHIDYVEMNPSLTGIASRYSKLLSNRCIRVYNSDARRFIRSSAIRYDVVLIDLPEPSTLQVNRFYTDEFFTMLKTRLNPGGVVSLSLPTTGDYVSKEAGFLNSSVYNTLKRSFARVLPVPASRNFFLGSDSLLFIDIPALIIKRNIPTVYVNPWYLDGSLLKDRSAYISRNLDAGVPVNQDFHPVTMGYQLLWWMGIFPGKKASLILLSLVIVLAVVFSLNPVNAGMFTGGFTLASTEVIVIIAVQVLYGYVFQMIGIIIMLFMLGLAVGSGIPAGFRRLVPRTHYLLLQLALAICIPVLFLIMGWLHKSTFPDIVLQSVLAFMAFVPAVLVGKEYQMAIRLSKAVSGSAASQNYSADLFGSALGAFLTAVFLFPFIGLMGTGLILSLLNILSAVNLAIRR